MATLMLCRSAFFICAVPRTGSELLCDLLQNTGVAGNPHEYPEQDDEIAWRHFNGFSNRRSFFLHYVHRIGVTPNGVFSSKLMFEQMTAFVSDLKQNKSIDAGGMIETLDTAFGNPRYVQLLRKDKDRQAISFVRAAQTGLWTRGRTTNDRVAYDPALLRQARDFLLQKEMLWDETLKPVGSDRRLTLYYEEMVDNMEGTVSTLVNWLKITDAPSPYHPPSVRPQSDEISEQWLRTWTQQQSNAL